MKKIYPLIFLFFLLIMPFSFGQQYLTERLVELSIEDEKTKTYFEAFNTVFIQSNQYCNNSNCRASMLKASKKAIILEKEDLFMRNMNQYMEFISIRRKGNTAVVKIKYAKGGSSTLKFRQKRGIWHPE